MPKDLPARGRLFRCAVYTRKSTEEGLDQAFNSLDAQREACVSYISSQRHEGWTLAPGDFDDGGFSGGNMDRPALRRLLDEVRARRVDVIVLYKIDRLTRSLSDFARIVDVLDAAGASFVSVTQAFNTTTSMGRLTLNVLLSFAQFEREVTGERIRDKIAASKAKGMWMGGVVPLGYDVTDRKLVVNEIEAQTIRLIFDRYLALGSVPALQTELDEKGIRNKRRVTRAGKQYGHTPMSRGALYLLLQNRLYIGQVTHRGTAYAGEHEGIVDPTIFDAAQDQLERNRVQRVRGSAAAHPSLLAGILWDQHGRRMSPSHAAKQTKRYRYYVSRSEGESAHLPIVRVPAGEIEELVIARLRVFLRDRGAVHDAIVELRPDARAVENALTSAALLADRLETVSAGNVRGILIDLVHRIEVHAARVDLLVDRHALMSLGGSGETSPMGGGANGGCALISAPAKLAKTGKEVRLVVEQAHSGGPQRRDPALIKLIVKAHAARDAVERRTGETFESSARSLGHSRDYFGVLLRLSYLSPDIVAAILDGRNSPSLSRQKLARFSGLPLGWQQQRRQFEIASH